MGNKEVRVQTFLLKEYEALRVQLDDITKELIGLERLAMIASGAIWSWLATSSKDQLPQLIFWAPAIICTVLALRALGLHLSNMAVGKYIASIEREFRLPKSLGWETLMRSERPALTIGAGVFFWVVMVVINMAVPLFYIPRLN